MAYPAPGPAQFGGFLAEIGPRATAVGIGIQGRQGGIVQHGCQEDQAAVRAAPVVPFALRYMRRTIVATTHLAHLVLRLFHVAAS